MEQEFQHYTLLSCCHVPLVMHAYQCEIRVSYHATIRVCIYVREEHWAANRSHANRGGSFSMDTLNYIL
jgi:hypothetical protein